MLTQSSDQVKSFQPEEHNGANVENPHDKRALWNKNLWIMWASLLITEIKGFNLWLTFGRKKIYVVNGCYEQRILSYFQSEQLYGSSSGGGGYADNCRRATPQQHF